MDPNKLTETLIEIKTDISEIKCDLRHHIRRTDLAESNISLLREENRMQAKSLSNELQPVKRHVHMVEGGLKLLGLISLVLGIAATIYKLIG